ncbi:MAG: DUF3488 and transglutaminase-like domain-containing protein, partial [Verrucomicrobiota bacterium]
MKPGTRNYVIPRRPLILLAVAMLFTVPPLFGNLVWWVPALFIGAVIGRFLMEGRGGRLRSRILKLAMIAAGIGGIELSYHTLVGPEPGLSICLVLIAVKVLEAHTARDFHILSALGWFFCLAVLMISQSLATFLFSGIAFLLVLAAVLQFHRRSAARRAFMVPLRDTAVLILQAMPLVLVLFFLFPRGSGGFRFILNRSFSGRTGMSDSLAPGSIASLALSNEIAFRVEFPNGGMPVPSGLYWRGGVFTRGDGLNWKPAKADALRWNPEPLFGTPVRQRIVLQPHGNRWIFALDKPVEAPAGTRLTAGNVLIATQALYNPFQYEVTSIPKNGQSELQTLERKTCLQLPPNISPKIRDLVQSWMLENPDPHAVMRKGLQFFEKEKFRYSLSPGEYGEDALDDFLFRRRTGFCEHYAAAFATLMRVAGIPARVIVGYQGGEFNAMGHYLIVRQSYAHAWCEVWVPGSGWERVDPTGVLAPERVNMGFDSFFEMRATSDAGAETGGIGTIGIALRRRGILHDLQLAWETISYEWDTHVTGYDEDTQKSLFVRFGLLNTGPAMIFGWLILIGSVVMAVQAVITWWCARPVRDPLVLLYHRFCRRAAALGAIREIWEGPQQFSERAVKLIPSQAERIRR